MRVQLTDGPWKGREFDIPDGAEVMDPHPGLPRGRYVLQDNGRAHWVPNRTRGRQASAAAVPETSVAVIAEPLDIGPEPDVTPPAA